MAEEFEAAKAKMAAERQAAKDKEAAVEAAKVSVGDRIGVLFADSDDFLKKWGGPMLLGPLVPAIFAAFIIVSGQIMIQVQEGQCNFPLGLFVEAAVVVSYLFVLIYSWLWLGDTIYFEIKMIDLKKAILWPFSSVKWLMAYYVVVFFTSMIVFAVGSAILNNATLCVQTTPRMYSYVSFILGIYWLMFSIIIFFTIKQAFGDNIAKAMVSAISAPSQSELEERIFRKKFSEFDVENDSTIQNANFPMFLQALGVYVPDDEQPALLLTLDPEKTGSVAFDPALEWFLKMSGSGEDLDMDDDVADFMDKKG
jgi:hypothetical protein